MDEFRDTRPPITTELPADLPPWSRSLMRQIVRDCARPGAYNIRLSISDHPRRVHVQIEQVNRLRDYEP